MYKTKLQELCHQRAWHLPDYATVKEGPDHDPRFQATVTVNGLSFHSQSTSKSSKHAQNDVAKFAFHHFSSPRSSPPPSAAAKPVSSSAVADFSSNLSSGGTLQFEVQETSQIPEGNGPATSSKNDERFTDMQHLYKNQLQSYAQRRSLTLPVYSCERVGPPHASRFKCKVTIDGQTYESQEFFPTLSKAEHAAAKAALMSLAPNGVEEDESAYKNLLQELAQKECYCLPSYSTIKSGEAHRPIFVSTVDVEGELFTGQEARTKKQAELSAAKVAYTALKQRNSRHIPVVSSSGNSSHGPMVSCSANSSQNPVASCSANSSQITPCLTLPQQGPLYPILPLQGQKGVQFTSSSARSNLTAYLQQNVQPRLPGHDEKTEEDRATADVISRDPPVVIPRLESSSIMNTISSSPDPSKTSSPESGLSLSSTLCLSSINSAASNEHPVETNVSHYSKIIVHPRGTNMIYPPGSIVLSMSNDDWVAVQVPQSSK